MFVPPNAKTAEWTSDDAISLRNFLDSVAGQRALIHLAEASPELLGGGEINSILVRSGEVKGWSAVLNLLLSLTVETPQTTPERRSDNHPDLDDDSKFDPITNLPL